MSTRGNATGVALAACLLLSACLADGSDEAADNEDVADEPSISVTVPEARLTPFCITMIELSDELRTGSVANAGQLIIETYRAVRDDVPPEIADDFDVVLRALEAGAPPPTDPPAETVPVDTIVITVASSVAGSAPATAVVGDVDEGFDPDSSPADRINSFVAFECRGTGNNPGPPPTQPTGQTVPSDG